VRPQISEASFAVAPGLLCRSSLFEEYPRKSQQENRFRPSVGLLVMTDFIETNPLKIAQSCLEIAAARIEDHGQRHLGVKVDPLL
jgi:hypothetical protein